MNSRRPVLLASLLALPFALSLAACGADPAPATGPWNGVVAATGADALSPDAALRIELEWTRESWEEDVHADDDPPHEMSEPRREEYVVALSGAHARRWTEEGVPALRVIEGDNGWLRVGAVVVDLPPAAVTAATSEIEDWLTLLGATGTWPGLQLVNDSALADGVYLVGGDGGPYRRVTTPAAGGLPSRIDYLPPGAPVTIPEVAGTLEPTTWRAWDTAGGVQFPETLVRTMTSRLSNAIERTTVLSVTLLPDGETAIPARPTEGAGTLGVPQRRTLESRSVYMTRAKAFVTAAPGMHRLLVRAVEDSLAGRRGPDVLQFESQADAGVVTFTLHCPVNLSHEAGAKDLPAGVVSGTSRRAEVLAFPYRGAYPTDDRLLAGAEQKARELGLEPAGPLRYAILGDPATAEPGDVEMEVLLPVRGGK